MNAPKTLTRTTLAALAVSTLAACATQPGLLNRNPAPVAPGLRQLNTPAAQGETVIPGRFVVKYRPGVMAAQAATALNRIGAQKVKPVGAAELGIEVIQVPAGQNAATVEQTLEQNPAIEYVEPVFTVPFPEVIPSAADDSDTQPAGYPNDPKFGAQYSHQATQSQVGWSISRGDRRTLIAIVDSGVDINHPDLQGKIVDVYNGADGNKDVVDYVGHGTHVAGIAAAMTNNGLGVAGVAPECGILAVKVASGNSSYPSTEGIANGIIWAADHGADVINLSLGSRRESEVITDAVKYALSKNVVVLAATGNDSARVKSYPAAVPGVIAVGSTDERDQRSSFSNYGDWVSVTAPGSNILSTFPFNDNMIGKKEYGSISGTSMATPFATGLAGLIRSKYPNMPVAMVKRALETSADDKGTPGYDEQFGFGRVNVGKAMMRASELATETP